MKAIVYLAIALAMAFSNSYSSATTISFNFSGSITSSEVRNNAISFQAVTGDAFTGNITYSISPSIIVSSPGVFNFEIASISMSANGSLFTAHTTPGIWSCWKQDSATCPTGPIAISMTDNGIDGDQIKYLGRTLSLNNAPLPAIISSSSVFVTLLDSTNRTAVSSILAPISQVPDDKLFNNKTFSLYAYGSNSMDPPLLNVRGRIESISAAPVPEASTSTLLAVGICILALLRARKTRAT